MFAYTSISSIRILPSDKTTFKTENDFRLFVENTMRIRGGYYYFPNLMMKCPKDTLVLFQYDGMVRAIGILIETEKMSIIDERGVKYSGYYKFNIDTLKYLDNPIDKITLKDAYPAFNSFNQSKQIIPLEYLEPIIDMLKQKGVDFFASTKEVAKIIETIEAEIDEKQFQGKVREALIKVRINQSVFRERLLNRYNKCCLCGVNNSAVLIASHIKPWKDSNPNEKLDVDNGFLLCANHDKLFDNGLITFDNEGDIIISEQLSVSNRVLLNVTEKMNVSLTEKNKEYLEFHRKKIFKN